MYSTLDIFIYVHTYIYVYLTLIDSKKKWIVNTYFFCPPPLPGGLGGF